MNQEEIDMQATVSELNHDINRSWIEINNCMKEAHHELLRLREVGMVEGIKANMVNQIKVRLQAAIERLDIYDEFVDELLEITGWN